MFSQFTQLASKFSLDNLQEDGSDTTSKEAATPAVLVSPIKGDSGEKSASENNRVSETVSDLESRVLAKSNELQSSQREVANLKRNLKEEQERIEEYVAELHQLEEEKLKWQQEKSQLSKDNTLLEQRNRELVQEIERLKTASSNEIRVNNTETLTDDAMQWQQQAEQLKTQTDALQRERDTLQRQHDRLEEVIKSLSDELSVLKEQSENAQSNDTALEQKVRHFTDSNTALATRISELEASLEASQSSKEAQDETPMQTTIVELRDTISRLQAELVVVQEYSEKNAANYESRISAHLEDIHRMQEEHATNKAAPCASCAELRVQLHATREEVAKKQQTIDDMRQKMSLVTEKMKDKLRENIKRQQELDEDIATLSTQVQEKENALVSSRLKIDSLETSLEERKRKGNDMAEKYSDAQKELQRQLLAAQGYQGEISQLQRELEDATKRAKAKDTSIAQLHAQIEELQTQHAVQIEDLLRDASTQNDTALQESKDRYFKAEAQLAICQRELEASQQKYRSLENDFDALKVSLNRQEDAQSVLDDYKKRAQVALKQASATSSNLSAKIEVHESTISELTKQLHDANVELEKCISAQTKAEKCCGELREELKDKAAQYNDIEAELKAKIQALEGKLEAQAARLDGETTLDESGHSTDHDDVNEIHTASEISPQLPTPPRQVKAPVSCVAPEQTYGSDDEPVNNGRMVKENSASRPSRSVSDEKIVENNAPTLKPSTSGELYYVTQLQQQISDFSKRIAEQYTEMEGLRTQLRITAEAKFAIQAKLDEITAFHERSKKMLDSEHSAINVEYLKKCVYRLMITRELSEKSRLYPVITALLNFTPQEKASLQYIVDEMNTAIARGATAAHVEAAQGWFQGIGSALNGMM